MADFRVDTLFFRHNKTKRLQRMLGLEGVLALMKLWAYARDCKYDGDYIYTAEDIEMAVDWQGEPGSLVHVLASIDPYIAFLDAVDGGYLIHGWEEHNQYAATANNRTDAARIAANKRWEKKRGIKVDDGEVKEGCDLNNVHNAGACVVHDAGACVVHDANNAPGNAPSPVPVPVPVPSPVPENESKINQSLCKRDPPAPAPDGAPVAKRMAQNFYLEKFELFWGVFGDKRNRMKAWTSWQKIKGMDLALVEKILAGARRYAAQRPAILARNGIPKMAEGWLNDRRWEDENEVPQATQAVVNPVLDAAFNRLMQEESHG